MSDFGAIITFQKKSGSVSDDDKELIIKALKKVIKDGRYPSHIKDGDFEKLKKWEEETYCSMITEYFIDESAEEIREIAEVEDLDEAEDIINKLQLKLGVEFTMEAKFEDW